MKTPRAFELLAVLLALGAVPGPAPAAGRTASAAPMAARPAAVLAGADLVLEKRHTSAFVVGQNGSYDLLVRNVGADSTTRTTTVRDTLPPGLTYVSGSGGTAGWTFSPSGQVVRADLSGLLAPGDSADFTLTVTVGPAAFPAITNQAWVDTTGDTDPTNNGASDSAAVTGAPDLTIDKRHTAPFIYKQQGTYTFVVTNVGTAATYDTVAVRDTLPAGLTFASGGGSGWVVSGDSTTQLVIAKYANALGVNDSSTLTVTVNNGAQAVPLVTNGATVSTAGDANLANNRDTDRTTVAAPDLSIQKSHTLGFVVGRNAAYTISVRNVGGLATNGTYTVTDTLPQGLTYRSSTGAGWTVDITGNIVTASRSTLIGPGASSVMSLTVAVGPAAFPAVTNRATVRATDDLNGSNDRTSDPTTIFGAPNLSLDLRHTAPFTVGLPGSYRFVVRNVGSATTTGAATVLDTLPAGLTYVSDSGGWNVNWNPGNQVLTATYPGFISPPDSVTLDVTVAVGPAALPAVTNAALVTTSTDYDPTDDRDVDPTAVGLAVDASIDVRHATGFTVGQTGVYTIEVKNVGASPTIGPTTVRDTLPAGLTFASLAGAGWSAPALNGQVVTTTFVGSIAPGDTTTFALAVNVLPPAVPGVTNVASVSTPGDVDASNDRDTDPTAVGGVPDLTIEKRHDTPFVVGQPGAYTIVVRNIGSAATVGMTTVRDTLPPELTYAGGSGATGWNVPGPIGQRLTATYSGVLGANGDSTKFSYNVIPKPAAVPGVTNFATVSDGGDVSPANNRVGDFTAITGIPDLALEKRHTTGFRVGQPGTYTLVVRNIGTGPTSGTVSVLDTLPAGLSYVDGSGPGWTVGANGQQLRADYAGAIAPTDSAKLAVSVSVLDAAVPSVTNFASVTGGGDVTPANNRAADPTTVVGLPDLTIDVRHVGPFRIGSTGSYAIVVSNLGTSATTGFVTVRDTLPPGLTYLFAGGQSWFVGATGPIVTATRIVPIAPGDSAQFTMAVTIDPAALPAVTNSATVEGGGDATPANDRDVDVAAITGQGRLVISKRAIQTEAEVGGVVDYAVRASNVGEAPVSGAEIADVLPMGLRYVRGTTRYGGTPAADPAGAPGPVLHFGLGTLASGATVDVTYRIEVGPGSELGSGLNVASVSGFDVTLSRTIVSNSASASVRITPGVFGDLGVIVGRVVVDCGADAAHGQCLGIPGVRVVLEDGTSAVTDGEGKYSFNNVLPRLHVLRVDESTLPAGARLMAISNRGAGSGVSQFVDLKRGELHRADFVEGSRSAQVLDAVRERRRGAEASGSKPDSAGGGIAGTPQANGVPGLLALGLLNARLDWHGLSRARLEGSGRDRFEDELHDLSHRSDDGRFEAGGRGALFLSGTVAESVRVVLRYDSERQPERRLFRDIRPDEGYSMLGDASEHGFEAQSAGRLFARVERGTSFAMYGDFATPSPPERALGAFSRRLNGGLGTVVFGSARASAFASQGHQHQVVDDFPAQGISGPYTLSQPDGTLGSEQVEIIVRDRNQPALILRREPQVRFVDYTLEPFTGRLVFLHPIASLDERMNPVFIRVTYESALASHAFWVYGGETSVTPLQALTVGGAVSRDEDPLAPRGLTSGDATLRLGSALTLTGEAARSDSGGTIGGGVKYGRASRVEAVIAVRKLSAKLRALSTDINYDNPSAGIASGREEQGFELKGELGRGATLFGSGILTRDLRTRGRRDGMQFGLTQAFPHGISAEGTWRTSEEGRVPASPLSPGTIPNKSNTLGGRLTLPMPWLKQSSVFFEGEQDVTWYNRHRLALGGDVRLTDKTRLFARHENVASLSGPFALNDFQQQEYTVVGLTSDELKNGHVFSEYRLRDAAAGREALAAIGLRNRWKLNPGWSADLGIERNVIVRGGSGAGTAVTGALACTGSPMWKGTVRAEWRRQDGNDQWLSGATAEHKLSRDWAALGRTELFRDLTQGRTDSRSQLGFAYRGVETNRLSALMRYDNRVENDDEPSRFRRVSHVVSSHANWQPVTRLTLSGQLASKWGIEDHDELVSRTGVRLLAGRALYDLTPRFDVGATGRSEFGGGNRFGVGGELGWLAARNLRLAGGYNVFGFRDSEMSGADHTDSGPYLDFGYKFDPFWGGFTREGGEVSAP